MFLPFKTPNQMYKALVRSHLDYCDIMLHTVHHPPLGTSLNNLMGKIEKMQYQAALAVTADWQGSSRVKLYEELGWESLSERRMCKRVLRIYKIDDGRTPSYLCEKMPHNRRNLSNLPCVFQDIKCRTDRYLNSFSLTQYPFGITLFLISRTCQHLVD